MKKSTLLVLAVLISAVACKETPEGEEANPENEEVAMENEEVENEWIVLTDTDNLEDWKAYNSDTISDQWTINDGVLTFKPSEGERSGSENLITKNQYKDFELALDWKISEGGNSGIMWGVQEGEELGEPYVTGPEIQVLDNERHPDAKNGPVRQAGALYDMVPPTEDVTKPAGEWNETLITINHEENMGTVTINGTKVTEFPLDGEKWQQLVENSKFADWEEFGKYDTGHIALQDHGNEVAFRNIRIREIE